MSENKNSRSIVIGGEKVSPTQYKLITEHGFTYSYEVIDVLSDIFVKEDPMYRLRVMEGQAILLDWIEKKEKQGESSAYICWNYERRAMLEVKLKSDAHEWKYFGTEINPFGLEILDKDGWEKDPNCPLPKNQYT